MTVRAMPRQKIASLITKAKAWNPPRDASGQRIKYIDLGSIDNEKKLIIDPRYILADEAPSRARQLVLAGDILVSTVRPNLNGVAKVPHELDGATASTGFCVLRAASERLSPEYLFHWVKTPQFVTDMERKATGQSYPAVSDRIISDSEIPLPSLDEQLRIAAILDQADAVRRKRREALSLLDSLPLSVFHARFGDPSTNSRGIATQPLGSVARLGSGGTPSKSKEAYWNGSFPWVSPKDMKRLRIRDAEDKISEAVFRETTLKKIPSGTPLIVVRGMILAHTVPIAMTMTEVAINQDMKSIHFDNQILPEFGLWCLIAQNRTILDKVDTAAHGTKRLDTEALQRLPILIPSLADQRSFASVVESWDCQRHSLEVQAHELDVVFSSLQQRAFRGEL